MKRISIWGMFVSLVFFNACGGTTATTTTATTTTTDSTTGKTVPGDLVISSPTATSSASTSISKRVFWTKAEVGDAAADDFASKKTALQALIAGTNDCKFTMALPSVTSTSCYAPSVNYLGHPDGSPNSGQMPSGDLAIWNATQGTQACAAAKMTELVEKVASIVDNMVSVFGAVACAGKKASIALPAIGSSVDLASALSTYVSVTGLTFSAATLERLADSGANPVYKSTLTMSMSFGGATAQTAKIVLKHIPTATDNSTYKGKVSMTMNQAQGEGSNCAGSGASGVTQAGTILYEKTSATAMSYEMKFAQFCGTGKQLDSDNNISLADQLATSASGWGDNANYMVASINPSNGTGTVAYAWQAGQGDDSSRVFNITTTADASGNITGTAYAGMGVEIGTTTDLGKVTKFICNWAGPGQSHTGIARAQRQEISKASGATEFTATSSNITFAPKNDCNASVGDNFTYTSVDGGNPTNDRAAATSDVTNNLVPLTDFTFTVPTAPTDVGG